MVGDKPGLGCNELKCRLNLFDFKDQSNRGLLCWLLLILNALSWDPMWALLNFWSLTISEGMTTMGYYRGIKLRSA